jgi:hypothetical protein
MQRAKARAWSRAVACSSGDGLGRSFVAASINGWQADDAALKAGSFGSGTAPPPERGPTTTTPPPPPTSGSGMSTPCSRMQRANASTASPNAARGDAVLALELVELAPPHPARAITTAAPAAILELRILIDPPVVTRRAGALRRRPDGDGTRL